MSDEFEFGGEIAWRPDEEYVQRAHLTEFMNRHGIEAFAELMRRSVQDIAPALFR